MPFQYTQAFLVQSIKATEYFLVMPSVLLFDYCWASGKRKPSFLFRNQSLARSNSMSNAAASPGVLGSRAYIRCTNSGADGRDYGALTGLERSASKGGRRPGQSRPGPLGQTHPEHWPPDPLGLVKTSDASSPESTPRAHPNTQRGWRLTPMPVPGKQTQPWTSGLQFEQDIIRKRESVWQGCWGRSSLIVR